jgi:hypothetical protein
VSTPPPFAPSQQRLPRRVSSTANGFECGDGGGGINITSAVLQCGHTRKPQLLHQGAPKRTAQHITESAAGICCENDTRERKTSWTQPVPWRNPKGTVSPAPPRRQLSTDRCRAGWITGYGRRWSLPPFCAHKQTDKLIQPASRLGVFGACAARSAAARSDVIARAP